MSLGSDAVDWADLLQRILLQLCVLNFCINCNSSAWFEPSIVNQRNGPKCTQTLWNKTKHDVRFQWGWVSCIRCEKFGHDFVAWTFALIAPVQPILHRVSCSNEMVPNAPKHYETQQKLSLGSNGVDQVRSLQKHPTQLCGTNFCINWTSSAHFALSLLSWQNNPKCTQTLRNATKVEFRVKWGGSGAFVGNTSDATSWHKLLH